MSAQPVLRTVLRQPKPGMPYTVAIGEVRNGRLEAIISPVVLLDFAGNIPAALKAYQAGDSKEGERLLLNRP